MNVNDKAEFDRLKRAENGGQPLIVEFTNNQLCEQDGQFEKLDRKFAELADKYTKGAVFLKVDVNEFTDICDACEIDKFPAFHAYKCDDQRGVVVQPKEEELQEFVKKYATGCDGRYSV